MANSIKEYIYIAQAQLERASCKIGKTNNPDRRLKEYNSTTGKSKTNEHLYLFTCEVKDMGKMEAAIKNKFQHLREESSKEMYFYNDKLLRQYIEFIKAHALFIKDTTAPTAPRAVQTFMTIKKETPTLKERGKTFRDILQKAQKMNNDEFYTRYEDVKKEIEMYPTEVWEEKVVFCNCDDAVGECEKRTSAFAQYFLDNFSRLKLKKLICTHYGGGVDLFNQSAKGYIFTKDGYREWKDYPKNYTGSFDDPLSIKILNEETDIVCTNPPFSRASDYWRITIGSGKKFLIISNITNAVTAAFIPFFKNNKVWAGYNRIDSYLNHKRELVEASGHWYTNLPVINRPKWKNLKIVSLKNIPDKYKGFDDSKILAVDNCYIPSDYGKPFAVSARPILNGILEKGYELVKDKEYYPYVDGKKKFARVLIQKSK
jgi:predicted GIY-YIG superfamily endonuclease